MEFNTGVNEIQDAIDAVQHCSYLPRALPYASPPFPSILEEPTTSEINELLLDKESILGERMQLLSYQIKARKDLYTLDMEHIDEQNLGIDAKIMMLDVAFPNRPFDMAVVKRKSGLEAELHQLHSEKRRERIGLWSDLAKLYSELQEAKEENQGIGNEGY